MLENFLMPSMNDTSFAHTAYLWNQHRSGVDFRDGLDKVLPYERNGRREP
jgi:hypothetical protein